MKPVRPTRHTRMLHAAVILILVTLAGGVVAAPAQAAAFRFWGYFHLEKGAWAFAQTGQAKAVPADGSVEGWRFAVADQSSTRAPRATPSFDALCAGTPATAGSKRVGLVVDYGRPADSADGAQPRAARAACVTVEPKATGSDVLVAAEVRLRMDKELICAIDGWPATGCGESVDPVPGAAKSPDTTIAIAAPRAGAPAVQDEDNGSIGPRELALGAAALVLIAALGFVAWRRSREATDG